MKIRLPLAAACVAAVLAAGTARAETVLRVSNWLPPTHPITTDIIQVWANNVEKETKGSVKVQILPALGKPEAHFDLVKNGIADVAMSVDGYTADRFKLPYAVKLPMMADDSTSASVAYWRVHQKHFAKHNEFAGVKLLTLWVHGPGNVHTVSRNLQGIDDLKNLKARVSGDVVQEIATKLDMVPQFAPASQSYELLSNGVVDGILFNLDSICSFKIDRVLKNALIVPGGVYRDSHYMIMNQRKFDSLTQGEREAIDRVSGETLAWIAGKAWDDADKKCQASLDERKYNFINPSPEFLSALKQRLSPLEQGWIERVKAMGVDGAAVLADYRAEIEKVKQEKSARGQ